MSEENQNPTTPSQPTELNLNEQAKNLANLRIAHEAIMVDDAAKVLKQVRKQVDSHQKAMEMPSGEEEDMGISVGNTYHITMQQAETPVPQPVYVSPKTEEPVAVAPTATSTPKVPGLGLAKIAGGVALALATTGVGAGIGYNMAVSGAKDVVQNVQGIDSTFNATLDKKVFDLDKYFEDGSVNVKPLE